MAFFQNFVRGLGTQNAPFGFGGYPVEGSPSQSDPAFNSGLQFIGNVGMGMLASGESNPLRAFGRSYLVAQNNAQDQNRNQFLAQQMMDAAEEKKQERQRQNELTTHWQKFVANNPDKFGQYAEIAPYLSPNEGMSILAGGEAPASVQEYQYAVQQGYNGSLADWKKLNSAGTTVNISPGDNAFDKEASVVLAKRYGDLVADGDIANSMKGDIAALKDIGTMVRTGKGAEVINALGPYADALGVRLDGLGPGQAYEAIVSRLAPSLRTPGVGSSSDFDAKQFLRSLPALGNTPKGNQIISDTLDAIANHKIAAAEIASAALRGEITRAQAEKELRALPDPWTAWKRVSGRYSGASVQPGSAVQDGNTDSQSAEEWTYDPVTKRAVRVR